MLSFEEAFHQTQQRHLSLSVQQISTLDAFNRWLAQDVFCSVPLPQWTASAMDGFAYCGSELSGNELEVVGECSAGRHIDAPLLPGQAVRIFTGAVLPKSADTVVIQENTEWISGTSIRLTSAPAVGANVRIRGEECPQGELLLSAGIRLEARHIALLIAGGVSRVTVYKAPVVALIATGDELRPPFSPLATGELWSTNSIMLQQELQALGCETVDCGVAKDSLESTTAAFERAIGHQPELILCSGGVSVGDYDFVREALQQLNTGLDELHFWKVRMKPGKPLVSATISGISFFGLPGNPVSSWVSYRLFVRALLLHAFGIGDPLPKQQMLWSGKPITGGKRLEFLRVKRVGYCEETALHKIDLTGGQSSAWLSSIAHASALLPLQPGQSLEPGKAYTALVIEK